MSSALLHEQYAGRSLQHRHRLPRLATAKPCDQQPSDVSNDAEGNQDEAVRADGSAGDGVNAPSPGKRRFVRASFERAKKVIVNKAADCVRENCVRKKSASPGTFDEKKPKVAAKRRGPRPG